MSTLTGWRLRPSVPQDRDLITQFLTTAHHRHLHFDWFAPEDLTGQAPFLIASRDGRVVGCLALPPDPPRIAWVRLFAIAAGESPSAVWNLLWPEALRQAVELGVRTVAALALERWFYRLLERAGFRRTNSVLFLEWRGFQAPPLPAPPVALRPMEAEDLAGVAEVDAQAFAALWQHSPQALKAALNQAAYATVAEIEGRLVGYQISTASAFGGHLARLAVAPAAQGLGIGQSLVADLIQAFLVRGINRITVNTQADNLRSQRLYTRLGFRPTGQKYPVFELSLASVSG